MFIKFVRGILSPYAAPAEIEFIDKLPKTRSGKIMRRLLKAKEIGADLGDTSALTARVITRSSSGGF